MPASRSKGYMPDVKVEVVGSNQPVSGPTDSVNIDFGALKAQASALLDAENTDVPADSAKPELQTGHEAPPEDPSKVRVKGTTTSTNKQEEPASKEDVQQQEVAEQERKLAALKDDDLVEVVVDGEPTVMTWKEARGGVSRTAKFTKEMQKLAKDREAVEASQNELVQLKQDRDSLNQFLANPKAILQFIAKEYPDVFAQQPLQASPAGQAPQTNDPNEIATFGDAQSLIERQLSPLQKKIEDVVSSFEEKLNAKEQEIFHKQQQAKHEVAITSTLSDIFTEHPILTAIPNAEQLIRFEVFKMAPKTEAEALEAFKLVSQGMAEELGKHQKAQMKIQRVAEVKAKLDSKSIEPSGGSAPQITPASYKKTDGSVDWNKLRDMAASML